MAQGLPLALLLTRYLSKLDRSRQFLPLFINIIMLVSSFNIHNIVGLSDKYINMIQGVFGRAPLEELEPFWSLFSLKNGSKRLLVLNRLVGLLSRSWIRALPNGALLYAFIVPCNCIPTVYAFCLGSLLCCCLIHSTICVNCHTLHERYGRLLKPNKCSTIYVLNCYEY